MRLNLEIFTFRIRVANILGFHLTESGIEANPNKCEAIVHMSAPTLKKEVQKLNGMHIVLNIFISKYV